MLGRTLQSVRRSIWELKVAMLSAEGSGPPGSGPPGNVPGRAAALSGLTMKRLLVIVYPTYIADLLQGAALVAVRTPCM